MFKHRSPKLVDYDVKKIKPSRLIALYLIHSYIYYELGESVISDKTYDEIAQRIKSQWMFIRHRHKDLIDRKALGTSGFYLKYPTIVQQTAKMMLEQWQQGKLKSD